VLRKLRSNLEPGTALWVGRRAQWRALGISDEAARIFGFKR
jgi:hypothetical protein